MAPLIDCVFLLLIFFLVATTLKKIDEELPLLMEDQRIVVEVSAPLEPLTISIDDEGGLTLNGTAVNETILQKRLQQAAAAQKQPEIHIIANQDTPTHHVITVIDMIRFEKLNPTGISTRRSSGFGTSSYR